MPLQYNNAAMICGIGCKVTHFADFLCIIENKTEQR